MVPAEIWQHREEFCDYLDPYISERRKRFIRDNLAARTRAVAVVLEDIQKSHNANAVLRTCDCFGIQDVHIIENEHPFSLHSHIASGAVQWLSLFHHRDSDQNNTVTCLKKLKERGYRILATSLNTKSLSYDAVDLSDKVAVMFGTEYTGLSASALQLADDHIKIPMVGFTESLNLSVSAGILIQYYRQKLMETQAHSSLTSEEQKDLLLDWYMKSVRNVSVHARNFLSQK